MSTPNYPRTETTIRPPLRILDAAGEPVLGLSHDAPGLAIEWRRVGGPATWTPAPQTAAGWTETGAGFYDATINVGGQADQTVAVRWTYGGVTSLPGLVSFTGFTGETGGSTAATLPGLSGSIVPGTVLTDRFEVDGLATDAPDRKYRLQALRFNAGPRKGTVHRVLRVLETETAGRLSMQFEAPMSADEVAAFESLLAADAASGGIVVGGI